MTIPAISPQAEPVEPEPGVELYPSVEGTVLLDGLNPTPWSEEQIEALRATSEEFANLVYVMGCYIDAIAAYHDFSAMWAHWALEHLSPTAADHRRAWHVHMHWRAALANAGLVIASAANMVAADQVDALINGLIRSRRNLAPRTFQNFPSTLQEAFSNWPGRTRR